jgi:hypothetical protein
MNKKTIFVNVDDDDSEILTLDFIVTPAETISINGQDFALDFFDDEINGNNFTRFVYLVETNE